LLVVGEAEEVEAGFFDAAQVGVVLGVGEGRAVAGEVLVAANAVEAVGFAVEEEAVVGGELVAAEAVAEGDAVEFDGVGGGL
jgi:hypothetical protein